MRTPGIDVPRRSLSGGNQQKLIVGREMSGEPALLIAAHPTRGVDVGAQAAIWDLLRAARARGLAVLLVSADLDELIGLSDTLRVMLRGRLVADADPATVTPEELGSYMTGAGGAGRRRDGTGVGRRASRSDPRPHAVLALAAPCWPLLFALLVARSILLISRRTQPAEDASGCDVGLRHRSRPSIVMTINLAVAVLPRRGRGRHRLPDEPVQHRRRRPVPARRADRRGGRRRRPPASDPARSRSSSLVAMCAGAAWAAIAGSAEGHAAASARSSRRSC